MSDDNGSDPPLYKRDNCVCCDRWTDMLRVDSNNRICDVCNEGPICFDCYCKRGDWLDFCVCKACAEATPLAELGNLKISSETYKPRFYKPNIRPTCDLCDSQLVSVCCLQCQQKICNKCLSTCDKCSDRFCDFCEEWSDTVCARCGDPEFDGVDWGKTMRTWDQATFSGDFTGFGYKV